MGNIVLLDDLTINKIAAGEVIERPASVVKELVENSIDAGATNISIEIKNGGISYIRITDNGKGFLPDDMEIAFERHATSKIRQADDLQTVTSMGFRGEALASIASISHVELISRTAENDIGSKIEVQGGKIINKEDAGCPKGTTITVTDLFYNTPVRYKFLKKDFTEAGYIEDVVTRIALVNPNIAIKLINTGKTIIQTSGNGDMKSVIYNIYGKDVAENIIDVNYEYADMKIVGVIGKPVIARSNRSNQLFFVNKRYIKDKVLTSAAEQGYKGMLTIGKYGFLVLNIEMNPQKVDVNVHPAKLEVRFEEENSVFKAIYHAIKDSLLKGDLVPDRTKIEIHQEEEKQNLPIELKTEIKEEPTTYVDSKLGGLFNQFNKIKEQLETKEKVEDQVATKEDNFIAQIYNDRRESREQKENNTIEKEDIENTETKEKIENEESLEKTANKEELEKTTKIEIPSINNIEDTTKIEIPVSQNLNDNGETKVLDLKEINEKMQQLANLQIDADYKNFDEMYARTFGTVKKETKVEEKEDEYKVKQEELKPVENVSIFENTQMNMIPNYKFVGIAFSTYIIIEMDKELYIIDQHAAHERIMYEKVKKNYYSDSEKDSQLMLLPDVITLSHRDMEIAKDNMTIFRKAGFILEEFGENTIKLTGVPNVCIDLDTKELFLETLDEINTVARTAKQEVEEKFIATVACKAAVKANMALTKEEVENLMKQLLVLPNPFTCPHGRPTAIKMTKTDIEKKFSRR